MSSFRRYGGLNFSANNNVTKSYISNSEQMNVNNYSGQLNSIETYASNIDMSGNSILHINTLYFQDGTSMNTANNVGVTGFQSVDSYSPWILDGNNMYYNIGNVGIGLTTPSYQLDMTGDIRTNKVIAQNSTNTNGYTTVCNSGTTGNPGFVQFLLPSSLDGTNHGGYVGFSDNGQNLQLGLYSSYTGWQCTGNFSAFGSITNGSDYRLKEDITPLSLDTYTIDNLNPVSFYFKNDGKKNIGLVAHELQEHYPFLVEGEKDGSNMQTVNYIGLIGILIKETQELKKRVKYLESLQNA
jgi:hypothetical protein